MDLSSLLLLATANAQGGAQEGSWLTGIYPIVMLVIMVVIFYFFILRPQKKKQKEEEKMRNDLRIGDEILTIGGIYGKVVSLKEDSFVMESLVDKSKLKFARWAIQQNLTVHDEEEKK